jgi:hypothetical protein
VSTNKIPAGWTRLRQQLKDWSQSALLALIKDLHDASSANRDFLQARLQAEDAGGEALESYRARIVEQFFPRKGFGQLKLAEARKAIRDYRKATGNIPGVIDLMLSYVENGTDFTREFGDINEAYYNSLESVMNEMSKLLLQEGEETYSRYRDRILDLEASASGIGWGYGDYVREQVNLLEDEFEK